MSLSQEYKLIVAGGRDFSDARLFEEALLGLVEGTLADYRVSIVTGMARGADELGYLYAQQHQIMCYPFPAKWHLYGKKAGMIRNSEMGAFSDGALIFWDGKSRGTANMIETMHKLQKDVRLVSY